MTSEILELMNANNSLWIAVDNEMVWTNGSTWNAEEEAEKARIWEEERWKEDCEIRYEVYLMSTGRG